jgi:hypothetical protein
MGRRSARASMAGGFAPYTAGMEEAHPGPSARRPSREASRDASRQRYAQRRLFGHGRAACRRSRRGRRASRHWFLARRQARPLVSRMGRDRTAAAFNRGQRLCLLPLPPVQRRRLYSRSRRPRQHSARKQPFARRHRGVRALSDASERRRPMDD